MSARFPEDLDQEVGGPIENGGLLNESFGRCHVPDHSNDFDDVVETSSFSTYDGKGIFQRDARRVIALLYRQVPAKFSLYHNFAVMEGDYSA